MQRWLKPLHEIIASHRNLRPRKPRASKRIDLSCDALEDRVTPSHFAAVHHLAVVHVHAAANVHHVARHTTNTTTSHTTSKTGLPVTSAAATTPHSAPATSATITTITSQPATASLPSPPSTTSGTSTTTGTSPGNQESEGGAEHGAANSALSTAIQTLQSDIQTIQLASGTTVGEQTALRVAYQKLASDGLYPSSHASLSSFENTLVTTNATTPGSLTGNTTLLTQFQTLYTPSTGTLSTQQTADVTAAYNALAAAVTSAGITASDVTTVNTDWSAVLAAAGSTSTATYPYFSLVTGQGIGDRGGFGFGPGFGFDRGFGFGDEGMVSSTFSTAMQTLQSDVQTIQLASGTTVGEQTALRVAFQKLASDGLYPSSHASLSSFENTLVTTNATTPGSLTGNTTLLTRFQTLYTPSSGTLSTQQTADVTAAYNALAAAVTSAGITASDVTTVNADWSAVLAAAGSTSTATYPYFTLVTGEGHGDVFGPGMGMNGAC